MTPLSLSRFSLVSAIGSTRTDSLAALIEGRSGLRRCDFLDFEIDTCIGRVDGLESAPIGGVFAPFDCRNNRLARLALEADGFDTAVGAAKRRYGADRIAVIVGTSTSGILESELAYRRRSPIDGSLPPEFNYRYVHNTFSVADFARQYLGVTGPALAISTACSSSAKAFATASRYIDAGFCDAAVVGGVDSLCGTTLYGFHALQLTAQGPCRPADRDRDGISIGEAAGFALLEKAESGDGRVRLVGYGESSDAYHMSSPHPEGTGAILSMQAALRRAGVDPDEIDHILLHGTGTQLNDIAEDKAVSSVFPHPPSCSSIKGWTGHTLGAAGIVNAVVAALSLEDGLLPGTLQLRQVDPEFRCPVLQRTRRAASRLVLSNAFGFGGNNASLILGLDRV